MDQSEFRTDKYTVIRTDGKPVGRTFVIEIDKDPQAISLLHVLACVYNGSRPMLAESLFNLAEELTRAEEAKQ